jgi:predicted transcriptional regulator
MMHMRRTTISAEPELLERLRNVARREGVSFAEVVRQALEWRVSRPPPSLAFIGAGASKTGARDTARRAGEMRYEPRTWRS